MADDDVKLPDTTINSFFRHDNSVYIGEWENGRVTVEQLYDLFLEFGPISKMRMLNHFALILYESRESAEAATSNQYMEINGVRVRRRLYLDLI